VKYAATVQTLSNRIKTSSCFYIRAGHGAKFSPALQFGPLAAADEKIAHAEVGYPQRLGVAARATVARLTFAAPICSAPHQLRICCRPPGQLSAGVSMPVPRSINAGKLAGPRE
jgi:hypothetical protein